MKRIPLIAGNWKMHKTSAEAKAYIQALAPEISASQRRIFLAVPYTAIESCSLAAKGTNLAIGAQNMHDQLEGAFTGEISSEMLKGCGAVFVLLGHSERRQYFAETNGFIHRKLKRALAEKLTPVLCIGEWLEERELGEQERVLEAQLREGLEGLTSSEMLQVVIAYEPVWAVGTGKTATPEIAQAVNGFIRAWLVARFDKETAEKVHLLYGGSVKPDNISSLMEQNDIDGVLVGGASLDVKSFSQIINYSEA